MPKKVAANKKVSTATAPVAAKKTARAKAPATGKKAELKLLVCAPDDKCFWTTDGQILKNLEELKLAFGSMADEVYLHHVSKERNDFADWVELVLEDRDCATALRKAKKPATAETVVIRHLRAYSA